MTDKELLEAAARAAGVEYEPRYVEPAGVKPRGLMQPSGIANIPPKWWNPLTDDGDALRLACKLGMNIDMTPGKFVEASIFVNDKRVSGMCDCGPAPDYYAATRRAIVRAAAALDSWHNAELSGREAIRS